MIPAPEQITLTLWVVYRRPSDFSNSFVVRRQLVLRSGVVVIETAPFCTGPSLDAVRSALPPYLYNMGRQPEDDPVIEEVWI